MKRLFSPWRSKYIETFYTGSSEEDKECVLCKAYKESKDDEHFVVKRGNFCFVVMNTFPYNSGHLMIVPYKHCPDLSSLSDEEMLEVMQLLKQMLIALREICKPDGFNIGSNIGRSAGAGIDQHIHFHIVPRWNGDTNFMPVLNDTKTISEDMREMLFKLRKVL